MASLVPLWYTETARAHHLLSTDNTCSNGVPYMQHLGHVFESTTRQRCNDGYGVTCGPLIARHTANHASQLSRFCAILAFLDGRENDCVSQIILKPRPAALIQTLEDLPNDTDNLSSVLDSWPWTPRLSFFIIAGRRYGVALQAVLDVDDGDYLARSLTHGEFGGWPGPHDTRDPISSIFSFWWVIIFPLPRCVKRLFRRTVMKEACSRLFDLLQQVCWTLQLLATAKDRYTARPSSGAHLYKFSCDMLG
jgi:hypothetical protein